MNFEFFWQLFFEVKERYLKKKSTLSFLCFFLSENFAVQAPCSRGQIHKFFGMGLIKIHIPDRQHSARFLKSKKSFISLHPYMYLGPYHAVGEGRIL